MAVETLSKAIKIVVVEENRNSYIDHTVLKYEIDGIVEQCVPLNNKENSLRRNTCQKKLLEK